MDNERVSTDNGILGKIETGSKNGFLRSVGVLGVDRYYKHESTFVNGVYDMVRHRTHSHIKFELEYEYLKDSGEVDKLCNDTELFDLYGIRMTPEIEKLREGYTNFYGGLSSVVEKNDAKVEQNGGLMLNPYMRDNSMFDVSWNGFGIDRDRGITDYDKAKLTVYGPPEVYIYNEDDVKESDGNFQNHDYKLTKYEFTGRSLERLVKTVQDIASKRTNDPEARHSLDDLVQGTVTYVELSMKRQRGFDDVSPGYEFSIRELEEIDRVNKTKDRMEIGPAVMSVAKAKRERELSQSDRDAERNTQKYYELNANTRAAKELAKQSKRAVDERLDSYRNRSDDLAL